MNTVTVNAEALKEVLECLIGPPHFVRELQALRNFRGDKDPVTILINEYNAQAANEAPENTGTEGSRGPQVEPRTPA